MFKPDEITIQNVLDAIKTIENKNISLIPSTRWLVEINGKSYPPKEIMRYAHQQMNGYKEWRYGGGEPTNKYLEKMGFKIIDIDKDSISELVGRYKEHLRNNGLKSELYKWELIGKYIGKPDINAKDLYGEIKRIDFRNLIYHTGIGVINHLAKDNTEKYRNCLSILFNEEKSLKKRLEIFDTEILKAFREIQPEEKHSHHHDERTIATLLTFNNPEKYTFFKDSFYQKYCRILGVNPKQKGEKYIHYINLIDAFIDEYIINDQELLDLVHKDIPETFFKDANCMILAQDILFQTLDLQVGIERNYWRVGTTDGQNSYWEIMKNEGIVSVGWPSLGDLNEEKIISKKDIAKLLKERGAYDNKSLLSRKAGEIYNFYENLKIGDVVLAQEGATVLGIGIIADEYFYNEKNDFAHQKKVNWILDFPEFKNKEGLQTTIFQLKDIKTINHINGIIENRPIMETLKSNTIQFPLNQILYGPPGTGKTYNTILKAAQIIENDDSIIDYDKALNIFNKNLHHNIEFITFHQNYSYEDFIQGLRPDVENGNDLSFEKKDGVFKEIADKAYKNMIESQKPSEVKRNFEEVFNDLVTPLAEGDVDEIEIPMKKVSFYITEVGEKSIEFRKNEGDSKHTLSISTLKRMYDKGENDIIIGGLQPYYNPILDVLLDKGKTNIDSVEKQNYVIIIDEINRANISRVFGELITLIEPDKRYGGKIPLTATLPSGDKFIVPSNLYIIGTMNTADKSIALLDIALRRRFEFEAMYPQYEIDGKEIYDVDILEKINEQIIDSKGHDFQIGHAYFMGENTELQKRMNNKVIPLLLEYYMNDEKEVTDILTNANLEVKQKSWPLQILGRK